MLKYYFLPSLDKIKILVSCFVGKSDDVTDHDVIQQNISLILMILKSTSKFRFSAWLRQNFLQLEHYFSSNGVFPMITSLNDDITLKFPLHCIVLSVNIL